MNWSIPLAKAAGFNGESQKIYGNDVTRYELRYYRIAPTSSITDPIAGGKIPIQMNGAGYVLYSNKQYPNISRSNGRNCGYRGNLYIMLLKS